MTPEGRMIQYLRRAVKRAGGVSRKVVFTGHRGAPDQLIMLLGHSFFAEVKAPGCKPSPIQLIEHQTLRTDGGFAVYVVDSERAIDRMLLAEGASPFSGRGAP
ncbi:VRR-NUC domain-containing protein [Sutterella wadsworthensis]|jgi:hypothetical protein|uniref:VRR-NUC domain-containing protein n=3 Tax=Sutterella wadsworthensis TaxID=40545 RepID=UPI003967CFF5